jgi:PKD repeat protein
MGANVIPHNVHVWQDWLIISYYTDGGIIVDASRPENLIEVGNWDTFLGGNGGFSGAWGAYPFLPSGIILLTDIGNGLFVCGANYVRACWLEGRVTNAVTGANIFGAQVEMLDSPQANFATTGLDGRYETGQAIPGTFDVTFSANGYHSKTVPATLENGELTILDVALDPIVSYTLAGQTIKSADNSPLPGTKILLQNNQNSFEITSDANGNFSLANVFEGEYTLYAGAWGYEYTVINEFVMDAATPQPLVISLDKGPYKDDFILDYNWIISGSAGAGQWELGEPAGTFYNGQASNPDNDVVGDLGNQCYVTGNGGGDAGTDDVDNGVVTLTSPVMALANYNDPVLSYASWFFNDGGNGAPNDAFVISVTNGTEEVILENITNSSSNWKQSPEFHLADLITLTDNMQIIYQTSDLPGSGHLVEAAVDAFLVQETCFGPEVSFAYQATGAVVSFTNTSTGGTSVEWDFGDNSTSNEESPVHTYTEPGEYEVTLTVTHDCGFSVYTQTIVISTSGTLDLDENGYTMAASPNPFAGRVFVKYELKESYRDASLAVFDVLGQRVATAPLSANSGTVTFGNELPNSGVYFLRLVVDGKVGKAMRLVKM